MAGNIPMNVQKAIGKMDPTSAVRAAVRDALHDPQKLRGLLAPTTGPSGARWAAHIEPWLKATGVEMPQGWLNPQNQPEPGEPGDATPQ